MKSNFADKITETAIVDPARLREMTPYKALIPAIGSALLQPFISPLRHHHDISGDGDALLIMPAWRKGGVLVTKLITAYPGNAARDLATISGVVAVFDAETGAILMIIDGAALTARRTAAVAALAASRMMRSDSRRLLVIGTGALAPELAEAHAAIHDFSEIEICGRNLSRAENVAKEVSARLSVEVHASTDIPTAVSRADVIAAATSATVPFIRASDVRPGTHLGLIGAFTPNMAEAEGELLARVLLYADTLDGVLSKGGEVLHALNQGLFGPEHIKGDLAALVSAKSPRRSESEITVFKSVGHASQDLAISEFVLAQTR